MTPGTAIESAMLHKCLKAPSWSNAASLRCARRAGGAVSLCAGERKPALWTCASHRPATEPSRAGGCARSQESSSPMRSVIRLAARLSTFADTAPAAIGHDVRVDASATSSTAFAIAAGNPSATDAGGTHDITGFAHLSARHGEPGAPAERRPGGHERPRRRCSGAQCRVPGSCQAHDQPTLAPPCAPVRAEAGRAGRFRAIAGPTGLRDIPQPDRLTDAALPP